MNLMTMHTLVHTFSNIRSAKQPAISASREFLPLHWARTVLQIVHHPRVWVELLINIPVPHTSSRQHPSQIPNSPVT